MFLDGGVRLLTLIVGHFQSGFVAGNGFQVCGKDGARRELASEPLGKVGQPESDKRYSSQLLIETETLLSLKSFDRAAIKLLKLAEIFPASGAVDQTIRTLRTQFR
ncbi:MAG: hypothetical protein ABL999_16910 [Pyrinomonadaceae bacterium]